MESNTTKLKKKIKIYILLNLALKSSYKLIFTMNCVALLYIVLLCMVCLNCVIHALFFCIRYDELLAFIVFHEYNKTQQTRRTRSHIHHTSVVLLYVICYTCLLFVLVIEGHI